MTGRGRVPHGSSLILLGSGLGVAALLGLLLLVDGSPRSRAAPSAGPSGTVTAAAGTAAGGTASPTASPTPLATASRVPSATHAVATASPRARGGTPSPSATRGPTSTPRATSPPPPVGDIQPSFPIRAAFYYPWFPETWGQVGVDPFTNYHPSLGFYDTLSVVHQHIAAMQYGGIEAGIASWWGQGSRTGGRLPALLAAARGSRFRWSIYYEPEGEGDPSVAQIAADLAYIGTRYGSDPAYLRVGGRSVVFVYAGPNDACGMADRWKQGAAGTHAYLVLKIFSGYRGCASQPASWHQYGPAVAEAVAPGFAFAVSPGFWKKGEASPRLVRDPARFSQSVRAMVASGAPFQLITTFDEWGEGTAVESATEWASASGYGVYLDILHADP
ncbi:MAG: hypothetical protein ACXWMU_01430 [Candidatus Limnocylindrales bacterium]